MNGSVPGIIYETGGIYRHPPAHCVVVLPVQNSEVTGIFKGIRGTEVLKIRNEA